MYCRWYLCACNIGEEMEGRWHLQSEVSCVMTKWGEGQACPMLPIPLNSELIITPMQAGCWSDQKTQKSCGCSIRTCVPGSPLWTWLQCWSLLYHKAEKNVVIQDHTWIPSMCVRTSSPTARCKSLKEGSRMRLGWKSKFFCQSFLILNFSSTYRGKKKAQLGWSHLCSSLSLCCCQGRDQPAPGRGEPPSPL